MALSLLWHRFDLWPQELPHAPGMTKKKKKKSLRIWVFGVLMWCGGLSLSLQRLGSLLWHALDLWPESFHMPWAQPKKLIVLALLSLGLWANSLYLVLLFYWSLCLLLCLHDTFIINLEITWCKFFSFVLFQNYFGSFWSFALPFQFWNQFFNFYFKKVTEILTEALKSTDWFGGKLTF